MPPRKYVMVWHSCHTLYSVAIMAGPLHCLQSFLKEDLKTQAIGSLGFATHRTGPYPVGHARFDRARARLFSHALPASQLEC